MGATTSSVGGFQCMYPISDMGTMRPAVRLETPRFTWREFINQVLGGHTAERTPYGRHATLIEWKERTTSKKGGYRNPVVLGGRTDRDTRAFQK